MKSFNLSNLSNLFVSAVLFCSVSERNNWISQYDFMKIDRVTGKLFTARDCL